MEKKTIEIPEGYEARIEGNKVFLEPKFKAGDFITDGERIFQIKETVWERNNRNDGSTYCESLIVNLRNGYTYASSTDLKEHAEKFSYYNSNDSIIIPYGKCNAYI